MALMFSEVRCPLISFMLYQHSFWQLTSIKQGHCPRFQSVFSFLLVSEHSLSLFVCNVVSCLLVREDTQSILVMRLGQWEGSHTTLQVPWCIIGSPLSTNAVTLCVSVCFQRCWIYLNSLHFCYEEVALWPLIYLCLWLFHSIEILLSYYTRF